MLTFCEYMDRVLYGPSGYYSSGAAKSGKLGDYFTAPDVGPVFGQLLAAMFEEWEKRLRVDPFLVVEAGAGEGRLSQDILKAHPFHYAVVERSESRRKTLQSLPLTIDVSSGFDAFQARPFKGVLFGNELIDAFPVHRVRRKAGKLEELYVAENETSEALRFQWGSPSTPKLAAYFSRLKISLPEGYETEVNLAMADWLTSAGQAFEKGLLLLIDYGRPAYDYYSPERARGTLRAFSKHKLTIPHLTSPLKGEEFSKPPRPSEGEGWGEGWFDLTADVDFTSLALDAKAAGFIPLAFMEMGIFLTEGLRLCVEKGLWKQSPPSGLKYLLHPEGMGAAFHVLVLGKGVDPKDWTFEHSRLPRLGLPS